MAYTINRAYSEKELKLIGHFGLLEYTTLPLRAKTVYDAMMEKAFLENMQGPAVESLRRCIKALNELTAERNSAEFDALIEL